MPQHDIVRDYPTVRAQGEAIEGAINVFEGYEESLLDAANAVTDLVLSDEQLAAIEDSLKAFANATDDDEALDAAQVVVDQMTALLTRVGKRTERRS